MYLDDEVTIATGREGDELTGVIATVAAYVYSQSNTAEWNNAAGLWQLNQETKIIIEPLEQANRSRLFYRWQGRVLYAVREPVIHMAHGEPHHYTITADNPARWGA